MRYLHLLATAACTVLAVACQAPTTISAPEAETAAAAGSAVAPAMDRAQLLEDLRILAADDMQGRLVATAGSERARAYIISRFQEIGIEPINDSFVSTFEFDRPNGWSPTTVGTNIIGRLRGTGDSGRVMVLSAHYDHMGERGGQIWNGADDNASGVAALLAAAASFAASPPEHDIVFVAFDAEEHGLRGAEAFVASPPVPIETIAFNLNLDMLAMSDERILWAVGTYHYPFLMPVVEAVRARSAVNLPTGFDEPSEDHGADWTNATDSGAFHAVGIPFIYLGVDYHPHYHEPTDTYENMTLDFFQDASETVVDFARESDRQLDLIGDRSGR
ncbi:M20/M25/M40 family metallo-hydrolase [Maricaulis sp.]|uniref:M20/M25/M40 family metallo-hydrolase n=1 Tax=Maricaulis sp. TaxID=1486257 RepID=UPI003A95B49A